MFFAASSSCCPGLTSVLLLQRKTFLQSHLIVRHWFGFAAVIFAGYADGNPSKLYLPQLGLIRCHTACMPCDLSVHVSMNLVVNFCILKYAAIRRDFKGDYCDLDEYQGAKKLLRTGL